MNDYVMAFLQWFALAANLTAAYINYKAYKLWGKAADEYWEELRKLHGFVDEKAN